MPPSRSSATSTASAKCAQTSTRCRVSAHGPDRKQEPASLQIAASQVRLRFGTRWRAEAARVEQTENHVEIAERESHLTAEARIDDCVLRLPEFVEVECDRTGAEICDAVRVVPMEHV